MSTEDRITGWWAGTGPDAIAVAARTVPDNDGGTTPAVEIGIPATAVGPDGLVRVPPALARVLAANLARAADVAEHGTAR